MDLSTLHDKAGGIHGGPAPNDVTSPVSHYANVAGGRIRRAKTHEEVSVSGFQGEGDDLVLHLVRDSTLHPEPHAPNPDCRRFSFW